MFESTIELYDQYYQKHYNTRGFSNDLGSEVRDRLRQLDYLIDTVRENEQRYEVLLPRPSNATVRFVLRVRVPGRKPPKTPAYKEADEVTRLNFEIQLFTECFYYLAGRLRAILKNKRFPFPRLASFECGGARNVRNKLLEHVEEQDSLVTIRSFAHGGPQGPMLKAARYQGQEHIFPDKGLYYNAAEIKTNLERLINEDLAR